MEPVKTDIPNPFGAPVFYVTETDSTMCLARILEKEGYPDGTVIYADYQSAGRGRIDGRLWNSAPSESLLCTVLLRRKPASGFTLRAGLAVSRTFDRFLSGTGITTEIKWPNDVLSLGKKLAGILCEADGSTLYVGTGLNIAQKKFPDDIAEKATSLAMLMERATGTIPASSLPAFPAIPALPAIPAILTAYLTELKDSLENPNWNALISERLWMKEKIARFLQGDPGNREEITGTVEGIGSSGELLFRLDTGKLCALFSGEFPYNQ